METLKAAVRIVDRGLVRSRWLLLLAVCSLALLATQVGQARSSRMLTIKILSVVRTVGQKDVEPKGLSAGDRVTMTDGLYNLAPQFGKPSGALVGSDVGTLTVRDTRSADFHGTARLPGGTILVRGRVPLSGAISTVAVVGGTGRFSRARGTVSIIAVDGKRAKNIFRLTLH